MEFKRFYIAIGLILLFVLSSMVFTSWAEFRWIGHAIVSIIGLLLVIVVLTTGAMLAGRIKIITNFNVYKLHKKVSLLFGIFMLVTFFYGLWVTSQHGKPLLESVHGWLGLIIALGAVMQLIPSIIIKKRIKIKTSHMILGYLLASLVVLEVAWGIHITVIGAVKNLVLIHSISGSIAAFGLTWIIVEIRHLTRNGIMRVKLASYAVAFFNIFGCWIVGGYHYLTAYGSKVKPIIKAGSQPWAHQIIMETKEHVFIFLPIISLLLAMTLITKSQDDILLTDHRSRRAVIAIASLALFMVLLMFVTGVVISSAGNVGVGG